MFGDPMGVVYEGPRGGFCPLDVKKKFLLLKNKKNL
jgi:hypothetical protein